MFFKVAAPLYILTSDTGGVHFFPTLSPKLVIISLFYLSHPSGYGLVSHCGFDLHFPDGQ